MKPPDWLRAFEASLCPTSLEVALKAVGRRPPSKSLAGSFPRSHLPRSEAEAAALGKQSCWLKQLLWKAEGKFVQYTVLYSQSNLR